MDVNIIRGRANLTRTADAYAGTLSVGDTAYVNGGLYLCKIDAGNTTITPTVNINSIAAKTVVRPDLSAVQIGELKVGWAIFLYDSTADKMVIVSGIPDEIGVDTTTLTNGGGTTITLIPGQDNPIRYITGSPTLSSNYVFTFGGSPKDGDRFYFDYTATAVLGAQTITIAGISLTAAQALAGNVWIEAYYDADATTWRARMFQGVSSNTKVTRTFPNKAARDAAVPDFIGQFGEQTDINAAFQANSAGAGGWADIIYPSTVVYARSEYGNAIADGATGSISNPLNTLAEAFTVADAMGESATNRILIDAVGLFNEVVPLKSYIDYNLNNSIIDLQAGTGVYTIDDLNVACDVIIYGNATIKRTTAGSGGCIRTQNASTNLSVIASEITSEIGPCIYSTDGNQIIRCNAINGANVNLNFTVVCLSGTQFVYCKEITSPHTNTDCVRCAGGTQVIYGNLNGGSWGAENAGGTQTIYGDIVAAGDGDGIRNATGTQIVYGNIIHSGSGYGAYITAAGGTQKVYGDISSSANIACRCSGGTQIVSNGRIVTTSTNTDAYYQTGGTAILKSCTLIANGSGVSISNTSSVQLHGYNTANNTIGTSVTLTGGGVLNIDSGTT